MQDSRRQVTVSVFSAFWTPKGRHFQEVGTFINNSLQQIDQLYPNEKFGFNGRHIEITTLFVSTLQGRFTLRLLDTYAAK